jgi:uracil-DNA glycosylase
LEPETVLKEVASQVSDCKECQLSYGRKNAVPGEGPVNAQVMMIGEGPGFYENQQGRPFVGAAGNFLDELLEKAGIRRGDVFITNVVKCRPPSNRDPLPEELAACARYLDRQIEAINPLVIVTLGRFSMAKFLPNVKISDVHGQPAWVRGRLVVPMFHPAAALHQHSLTTSLERDFARLPEWIQQALTSGRPVAGGQAANQPGLDTEENARHSRSAARVKPIQDSLLFSLEESTPLEEEDEADQAPGKNDPKQLSLF